MSTEFWTNCLKAAALIVIGFGLMLAVAAHPAGAGLTRFFADLLIWPLDGNPAAFAAETRLLSAIGGGVMFGWGIMMWMITTRLMPREPAIARQLLTVSIVSWFVVDSTGSVLAGVPLNVAGNLAFLALFLVPLRALGRAETAPAGV